MKEVLRAKVQEITVTDCKIDYEGSITLCPKIMEKLGVKEFDWVYVNGKYKPHRIETYVLKGKVGDCELNGGATHFFEKGDVVHLLFKGMVPDFMKSDPTII